VSSPAAATALFGGDESSERLLVDPRYVRLIRWVFTARLVCLALAAPAALVTMTTTPLASICLCLLTTSSLVFSRSDKLIRALIRHPLLASVDTALSIALLISVPVGQPAALTVVCSALAAGLLFPGRVLVVLMVPLVVGSLGAPATLMAATPSSWQGWLALVAGLPALVLGVGVIGSVVRHNVSALIEARLEVAEAVAAVGAADERARLARDMHDSVGKSIHGISLGAKALPRLMESDPEMARGVARSLADSADQAAREARGLLMSLREGQVDRPTVEVVNEILAAWQSETGTPARLGTVEAVDAGPEVTHQMAYALREILHNVTKHARAEAVTVGLTGGTELIELTVTDSGVGFDVDRAAQREALGHFGLRGLRERAEQVGGSVSIHSEKRKGTTVRWTARPQPRP
jgi:signal transduction histidine kinase